MFIFGVEREDPEKAVITVLKEAVLEFPYTVCSEWCSHLLCFDCTCQKGEGALLYLKILLMLSGSCALIIIIGLC